jgi:hypothetical protein
MLFVRLLKRFMSLRRRSWCYVSNATCGEAMPSPEAPGLSYAYFGPCGRGLHSSTSQPNFSHFGHGQTDVTQHIPQEVLTLS